MVYNICNERLTKCLTGSAPPPTPANTTHARPHHPHHPHPPAPAKHHSHPPNTTPSAKGAACRCPTHNLQLDNLSVKVHCTDFLRAEVGTSASGGGNQREWRWAQARLWAVMARYGDTARKAVMAASLWQSTR
eukprot:359720-Chlamydomonas_euryale.AAC.3